MYHPMYLHTCTIFGPQQSYKGSHLVSEFFRQLRKYHIMIWHVHTCKLYNIYNSQLFLRVLTINFVRPGWPD